LPNNIPVAEPATFCFFSLSTSAALADKVRIQPTCPEIHHEPSAYVWSGVVLRHLKKISFEWLMQPFATTAYVKSLGSRNAVQTAATHCCLFHSVWTIRTWPDQKQPNISSAADDLSIADRFVSLIFAGLFLAQRPTTVQEQKE